VDPFRHEALRTPTMLFLVKTEATRVFGSLDRIHEIAVKYFGSIHRRFPIVSRKRFISRLPSLYGTPKTDFLVLSMCIHLIQETPAELRESMQSSLYVTVKGMISLLEATDCHSLEALQCRLLLVFYELGHAIFPNACFSICSCARLARFLGLNKQASNGQSRLNSIDEEERRRAWWAVVNLDRFINLCNGDSLLASEDPTNSDFLPVDDHLWTQENISIVPHATLYTSSDLSAGQFARECQVSHLSGRVIRHVFDPVHDADFRSEEAQQLERTLMAFMPLLMEDGAQFGKYCTFPIAHPDSPLTCIRALLTLYNSKWPDDGAGDASTEVLKAMEPISTAIVGFARQLFGVEEDIAIDQLSPYIPTVFYQSAVVQLRLWDETGEDAYKDGLDFLKGVLLIFQKRWQISGEYSDRNLRRVGSQQTQLTKVADIGLYLAELEKPFPPILMRLLP
ncbi:hypothetical protein BT63DRAFT_371622, partial [Microthyrium microscopicum]